jgi:hypothetical protein
MRAWSIICLALAWAGSSTADSLNVADTLHPLSLDSTAWADSALAMRDTLAGGTGLSDRWLWPVGIIAVSAVAVYLLFTVRSK